jgi:hypothetical protein
MPVLTRWKQLTTFGSRLDRFLVWSAVAALISATITAFLFGSQAQPEDYQPGQTFARVQGFDPSQSPATLAVFVRTNCGACERIVGSLHRIARKPRPFQVVVIGYEGPESLREFTERAGIVADAVLSVPIGTIRFASVPQLALLDHGGVIRSVWTGSQLINDLEQNILAAARKPAGPSAR